jgi:hypothetical protein
VGGPDILGEDELRVRIQFLNQSRYLLRIQSCWEPKAIKTPSGGADVGAPARPGLTWSAHPGVAAAAGHPLSSKMLPPAPPGRSIPAIAPGPSSASRAVAGPPGAPREQPALRGKSGASPALFMAPTLPRRVT